MSTPRNMCKPHCAADRSFGNIHMSHCSPKFCVSPCGVGAIVSCRFRACLEVPWEIIMPTGVCFFCPKNACDKHAMWFLLRNVLSLFLSETDANAANAPGQAMVQAARWCASLGEQDGAWLIFVPVKNFPMWVHSRVCMPINLGCFDTWKNHLTAHTIRPHGVQETEIVGRT